MASIRMRLTRLKMGETDSSWEAEARSSMTSSPVWVWADCPRSRSANREGWSGGDGDRVSGFIRIWGIEVSYETPATEARRHPWLTDQRSTVAVAGRAEKLQEVRASAACGR
ncbi:MAG: hypothetical protein ACK55I_42285 [bacterium]